MNQNDGALPIVRWFSIPLSRLLVLLITALIVPLLWAADGEPDVTFKPLVTGSSPYVFDVAIQPDGKILLAGYFAGVNNQPRSGIARLGADGSLDAGFNPVVGGTPHVNCVAVQPDGKILLAGEFESIYGQSRRVARLNADGSLDSSFNAEGTGTIWSMEVQRDGRIVIGGHFHSVGGQTRECIARLNTNGTLDETWTASITGNDSVVSSLALQQDDSILVGGGFQTVNGQSRNNIARLDHNGVLDTTFAPEATGSQPNVYCLTAQADGKILVAGTFDNIGGLPRNNIARLHPDGRVDTAFNPDVTQGYSLTTIMTLALQADGRILIGGRFGSVGGSSCANIARLNTDGTLDSSFNSSVDMFLWSLNLQADGKIIMAGWFTNIVDLACNNISRYSNSPPAQNMVIFSPTNIHWLRGDTAPEVEQVVFEACTYYDANWTTLGTGTRFADGWEMVGVTLPSVGILRARGRVSNGGSNGGMLEQMSPVGLFTTICQTNGVLRTSFAGIPGASYTIQSASSLNLSWSTLTNCTIGGNGIFVLSELIGSEQHYFRAVTP